MNAMKNHTSEEGFPMGNPKSETRDPKEGRNPKPEGRKQTRVSRFNHGFRSEIRISDNQ